MAEPWELAAPAVDRPAQFKVREAAVRQAFKDPAVEVPAQFKALVAAEPRAFKAPEVAAQQQSRARAEEALSEFKVRVVRPRVRYAAHMAVQRRASSAPVAARLVPFAGPMVGRLQVLSALGAIDMFQLSPSALHATPGMKTTTGIAATGGGAPVGLAMQFIMHGPIRLLVTTTHPFPMTPKPW